MIKVILSLIIGVFPKQEWELRVRISFPILYMIKVILSLIIGVFPKQEWELRVRISFPIL